MEGTRPSTPTPDEQEDAIVEFLEDITPDVYISEDTSKPPILLVLTEDSLPPDEPKFNIVDDYHIKTFFRYYYQLMTGMKESSGGASGGASGADAGGLSDTIDGYAFCKERDEADEEMRGRKPTSDESRLRET